MPQYLESFARVIETIYQYCGKNPIRTQLAARHFGGLHILRSG